MKNDDRIEHRLYSNYWAYNAGETAEGIVILDLVRILEMHFYHANESNVKICIDNRDFCNLIHIILKKLRKYFGDSTMIANEAHRIMNRATF